MKKMVVALLAGLLMQANANADDWGCEVLLCLSNPAGPMAVSECVPPITRLFKALAKPKPDPFPTCVMGGAETQNFARNTYQPFDDCPPQYPIDRGYQGYRGEQTARICSSGQTKKVCGGQQGRCELVEDTIALSREAKPNVIEVFIDGKINQKVRW